MAPSATTPTAKKSKEVPLDLLIQKRDSLVTSLTALSHAAQEASWASIEFFNLLHPEAEARHPPPAFHHLFSAARGLAKATDSPGGRAHDDDDDDMTIVNGKPVKRGSKGLSRAERKKARDPNEPKRPVTAYFLFLAHARPQLQKDMPDAKGNELQQEATERWNSMSDEEKRPYRDLYESNYTKFKKEMEEYKAKKEGRPVTATEETGAGSITVNEETAEAEEEEESEAEEEETPARPTKVAKTDSTAKSKSAAAQKAAAAKAAKSAKKETSKRHSKKKAASPEAEAEEAEVAATPKATPKKDRKRKR